MQVDAVNPEIGGAIGALQTQMTQITTSMHQLTTKMDGLHQMILPRLERLDAQSGDQSLILNAVTSMSRQLHQLTSLVVQQESHSPPTSQAGQSSIFLRTPTQLVTQSSSHPSFQNQFQHQHQVQGQPQEQLPQQKQQPNQPDRVYHLNNSVQTVVNLWNEYDVGFAGGPAIKDLEIRKKGKPFFNWHGQGPVQGIISKQWCRRKYIIQAILQIAAEKGIPENTVAAILEEKRLYESRKVNLKHREGATLEGLNDILKVDNDFRRIWLGRISWPEVDDN
ncbi:hypothetical protein DFS34DRAFT_498844 [Phlyctochytrium arcticum]|nr:hypothetical protein DFS34DRAFT_324454 [Phlyctochytrium arcticum]KAI9100717.1 hypothetical protein DFS34DRAFT_498844 [Phlyctochytrium arcticum]